MNTFKFVTTEALGSTKTEGGLKVKGLALPFEKVSRNGFSYLTESITKAHKSLEGMPVLFNHDSDKVIGKVQAVSITNEGMVYEMDLGTYGPYGWVAEAVARGDLSKVSIQASYDVDKSFIDESGVTNAWVEEFYELSIVTIPGFKDTTAAVIEAVRHKAEETTMTEPDKKPEDEPKPETEETVQVEEQVPVTESDSKGYDELVERIAALEQRFAEMDKAKESDEEDDEKKSEADDEDKKVDEADNEDDDKDDKVEEAIRKDKVTIANESTKSEVRQISRRDLIEAFASMR
jgi:HK97 family phage prohead protease